MFPHISSIQEVNGYSQNQMVWLLHLLQDVLLVQQKLCGTVHQVWLGKLKTWLILRKNLRRTYLRAQIVHSTLSSPVPMILGTELLGHIGA